MFELGTRLPNGDVILTSAQAAYVHGVFTRMRAAEQSLTVTNRAMRSDGYMAALADRAARSMADLLKPHMIQRDRPNVARDDMTVRDYRLVAILGGLPRWPTEGERQAWVSADAPDTTAFRVPDGVPTPKGFNPVVLP